MNKTLAICIPTFNRITSLKQCLESIDSQMTPALTNFVNVYIFDNNSTDFTNEYCLALTKEKPYIHYIRNKKNIGPDGNFLKILKSKLPFDFYHLMSDDDLFFPYSLEPLVSFLRENSNQVFVYLNVVYFWGTIFNSKKPHKKLCSSENSRINLTKEQFIGIIKNELSFLSGMVFNSKFINTKGMDLFTNTYWLQSYCLFNSTVNGNGRLAFYAKKTICKRNCSTSCGYDSTEVFGINYFNLLSFGYSNCGYSKKQLLKLLCSRWKKLIYWQKINNCFDLEKDKEIISCSKREKDLKSVSRFLSCPQSLCKLYHLLKHLL